MGKRKIKTRNLNKKSNKIEHTKNKKLVASSRYISKEVRRQVTAESNFRCAWCGTALKELHHIHPFADGGEHSSENLILLCPSCHTQVHEGEISKEELLTVKNGFRTDKFGGNILITQTEPFFLIAGIRYKGSRDLIIVDGIPILFYRIEDKNILFGARFYNAKGDLVFWMSSNRYYCLNEFVVTSGENFLEIKSIQSDFLLFKLTREGDTIFVEGNCYVSGHAFYLRRDGIFFDPGHRIGAIRPIPGTSPTIIGEGFHLETNILH